MKFLLLFVSLLCVAALTFGRRYDGYKLVRVFTETDEHHAVVRNLVAKKFFDVQHWSEPGKRKGPTDLLIAPHQHGLLTRHFKGHSIKTTTLHFNVQK